MSQRLSPLDYAIHMAMLIHYILIHVETKRKIRLRTAFYTSRSNCCRGAVVPEGYLGCIKNLKVGLRALLLFAQLHQSKASLSRTRLLQIRTSLLAVQKGAHYIFFTFG